MVKKFVGGDASKINVAVTKGCDVHCIDGGKEKTLKGFVGVLISFQMLWL